MDHSYDHLIFYFSFINTHVYNHLFIETETFCHVETHSSQWDSHSLRDDRGEGQFPFFIYSYLMWISHLFGWKRPFGGTERHSSNITYSPSSSSQIPVPLTKHVCQMNRNKEKLKIRIILTLLYRNRGVAT